MSPSEFDKPYKNPVKIYSSFAITNLTRAVFYSYTEILNKAK